MKFNFLLGLTVEEANEELKPLSFLLRVLFEDGVELAVAKNTDLRRLNVAIENNKITKIFDLF